MLRTPTQSKTPHPDERGHLGKALGVSGHNSQADVGMALLQQLLMSGEDLLFLAGPGATGYPQMVGSLDSQRPGKLPAPRRLLGHHGRVVFHGPRYADSLRRHTHRPETLGYLLVLSKDVSDAPEHPRGKGPNQPVCSLRAFGHSPVGHYHRNVETIGLHHEVVPDLQFHQDYQRRS